MEVKKHPQDEAKGQQWATTPSYSRGQQSQALHPVNISVKTPNLELYCL